MKNYLNYLPPYNFFMQVDYCLKTNNAASWFPSKTVLLYKQHFTNKFYQLKAYIISVDKLIDLV